MWSRDQLNTGSLKLKQAAENLFVIFQQGFSYMCSAQLSAGPGFHFTVQKNSNKYQYFPNPKYYHNTWWKCVWKWKCASQHLNTFHKYLIAFWKISSVSGTATWEHRKQNLAACASYELKVIHSLKWTSKRSLWRVIRHQEDFTPSIGYCDNK